MNTLTCSQHNVRGAESFFKLQLGLTRWGMNLVEWILSGWESPSIHDFLNGLKVGDKLSCCLANCFLLFKDTSVTCAKILTLFLDPKKSPLGWKNMTQFLLVAWNNISKIYELHQSSFGRKPNFCRQKSRHCHFIFFICFPPSKDT